MKERIDYDKEDKVAAEIGRDDASPEYPEKVQERLRHKQEAYDAEDKQVIVEGEIERLYQLLQQEGVVGEGEKEAYQLLRGYIINGTEYGQAKDFYEKVEDIKKRDEAGEWEDRDDWRHGETIQKRKIKE